MSNNGLHIRAIRGLMYPLLTKVNAASRSLSVLLGRQGTIMNVQNTSVPVRTGLFIGGELRDAEGGRVYDLHNPARPAELVGHAASATAQDVDQAVKAAHAAFPAWSALSYTDRGAFLLKIADALVADEEDVKLRSHLFCREHGKTLKETSMEMMRLGDRFRLTASYADRLAADENLAGPPFDTIITRQPRGVAALIDDAVGTAWTNRITSAGDTVEPHQGADRGV